MLLLLTSSFVSAPDGVAVPVLADNALCSRSGSCWCMRVSGNTGVRSAPRQHFMLDSIVGGSTTVCDGAWKAVVDNKCSNSSKMPESMQLHRYPTVFSPPSCDLANQCNESTFTSVTPLQLFATVSCVQRKCRSR